MVADLALHALDWLLGGVARAFVFGPCVPLTLKRRAGHQYRLQQVGRFVRVHIVHTPGRSRRLNVQIAEAPGGTEVTRPAFVSDGSKNLVPTSTKDGMDILRAHALSGNSWSLTSWHTRCQSVLRDDERKLAARLLKLLARP